MGRSPCCAKEGLNRGAWTAIEDKILVDYIKVHGEGKWRHLPKRAGLKRCGKSCRLRWLNYLRPDIKRGNITHDEEDLIIRLHKLLGNRWSLIAGRLPGRTDNEIKNYWNTNIGKKLQNGNSKTKSSPTSSGLPPSRARLDTDSDQDPDPKAPKKPTGVPCHLVRTKATRCTRVIVSREMQPLMAVPCLTNDDDMMNVRCDDHDDEKIIMETQLPPFMDCEGNDNDNNNNNNSRSANNELDFMADFEMDEGFFSDLLNMDISEPTCCFENDNEGVREDDNSEQGCHQNLSSSSPGGSNDDTHHLNNTNKVSEDSLHESEGFQSMSALMENEFDWL